MARRRRRVSRGRRRRSSGKARLRQRIGFRM